MLAQVATFIILTCGVTTKNVDTPKVQDCVDFYTNCVVDKQGEVKDKMVRECLAKWEKQNGE